MWCGVTECYPSGWHKVAPGPEGREQATKRQKSPKTHFLAHWPVKTWSFVNFSEQLFQPEQSPPVNCVYRELVDVVVLVFVPRR